MLLAVFLLINATDYNCLELLPKKNNCTPSDCGIISAKIVMCTNKLRRVICLNLINIGRRELFYGRRNVEKNPDC